MILSKIDVKDIIEVFDDAGVTGCFILSKAEFIRELYNKELINSVELVFRNADNQVIKV